LVLAGQLRRIKLRTAAYLGRLRHWSAYRDEVGPDEAE
jgi:hypothetical protein